MVVRQAAGGSVQHGKVGPTLCCAPKLGSPGADINGLAVLIGFEFGVLSFKLRIFCVSGNQRGKAQQRQGIFTSRVGSL